MINIKEVKELPRVECIECKNQLGMKFSLAAGSLEDDTQKCDWCVDEPGWFNDKKKSEQLNIQYKDRCNKLSIALK